MVTAGERGERVGGGTGGQKRGYFTHKTTETIILQQVSSKDEVKADDNRKHLDFIMNKQLRMIEA